MTGAARNPSKSPVADWLGYSLQSGKTDGDGESCAGAVHKLSFEDRHIGNPLIRAIHGGVVAAFFEYAAQQAGLDAIAASSRGTGADVGNDADPYQIDTVSINIDYLASTKAADLFARTTVKKCGRRLVFIDVEGWQDTPTPPVATAQVCLRIATKEKGPEGP